MIAVGLRTGKSTVVAVPRQFALDHDDGGIRPFKNDHPVPRSTSIVPSTRSSSGDFYISR